MATRDPETPRSNFGVLKAHDEQFVCPGMLAERYFPEDPNTSLLKLCQLADQPRRQLGLALLVGGPRGR